MLGDNVAQAGWPDCGEIDVLEMRGSEPSSVVSSLHAPGYYAGNSLHGSIDLPTGKFGDDFHTFTFEWTPDAVRWLLDGDQYFIKTRKAIEDRGHTWYFDHPFFIILNLAVGGIFDGVPAPETVFPQQMQVDYVSVARLGP
jgi:beta-glucanase (GH16 family)